MKPAPIFKLELIPSPKIGFINAKGNSSNIENIDFGGYKNGNNNNSYSPYIFRDLNQITEPFRLIISILKTLGNSPISSRRTFSGSVNQPEKLFFELRYFSLSTVCAAVVGITNAIIWSLFLLNVGFAQPFLISGIVSFHDFDQLLKEEESSANPVRSMVHRTLLITAVIILLELSSRWWHAGKFIHFLNKWNGFERKLAQVFSHCDYDYDFSGLMDFRDNLILFYVTYPSMILIPAFLVVYCSRLNLAVKILGVIVCTQFTAISLLEDVKIILSYKALQQAFCQVRKCVKHFNKTGEKLNSEVALSWRQLIQYIREQCERAGRYQKFEELCRLIGYTGLVTLHVYVLLNGWDHAQKRGSMLFLLSSTGYAGMLLCRIYFKAVMADNIGQEESKLAKAVLKVHSKNCDQMAMFELKTLLDVMSQSPAKISFGNYIVLNKRLLLAICSQIVTYLIVLMQFSQPQPTS